MFNYGTVWTRLETVFDELCEQMTNFDYKAGIGSETAFKHGKMCNIICQNKCDVGIAAVILNFHMVAGRSLFCIPLRQLLDRASPTSTP